LEIDMADEFVRMVKDGEDPIDVHPSCVDDHRSLGWKLASEIPSAQELKEAAETKAKEAQAIVKARAKK
jgi:hypothetical protein